MNRPNHFGKSLESNSWKLDIERPMLDNMSFKNSAAVFDNAMSTIKFRIKKLKNI